MPYNNLSCHHKHWGTHNAWLSDRSQSNATMVPNTRQDREPLNMHHSACTTYTIGNHGHCDSKLWTQRLNQRFRDHTSESSKKGSILNTHRSARPRFSRSAILLPWFLDMKLYTDSQKLFCFDTVLIDKVNDFMQAIILDFFLFSCLKSI